MSKQTATIGADPEVFLFNTEKNKIVPACGLVGGTKKAPKHLKKGLAKGYTIQEDNVMVEFNIPPARSLDQWIGSICTALDEVRAYVAALGPYNISIKSEEKFSKADLSSDGARQFGCTPDFDAYENGSQYNKINPDDLDGLRFCGGHVHLGFNADDVPPFVAAAFADIFIGMAMIPWDTQGARRKYYGQPGRYRPTSYGIEYRTPSNAWLSDYGYIMAVGSGALSLGNYLNDTSVPELKKAYQRVPWGAVRDCITRQDKSLKANLEAYLQGEHIVVK